MDQIVADQTDSGTVLGHDNVAREYGGTHLEDR